MKDAIFFDCDGVLVDSEPLSAQTTADLLATHDIEMSWQEANDIFIGKSMKDALALVHASYGVSLPASFVEAHEALLFQRFEADLRPIDGMAALLCEIDRPRCITSNSTHRRLAVTLATTGLGAFFQENVFSAEDVTQGKPAPDLFLHAARVMGADIAKCTVIDDNVSGIQAAIAAGARAIGFTGGSHVAWDQADRLHAAGACCVAANTPALLSALRAAA
ncbi:HAD family hydrolase [Antarcticimicrobium sediminis]|uniref:HAD family hydrolase n=1 Tax=Antarcticimicrobium sediminis TaxID=2546227 RepID=A0A4R5EJ66_9RHOB|nr:HAD-IA family hydrolase [Antarcticimicrobium sediminis]TDE34498.1 HAD family hydrolase [Antarcticimicrobium sediminis]